MIATTKRREIAVSMTAVMIVAGMSVVPLAAEVFGAKNYNTVRSNRSIIPDNSQEGEQTCINQVSGEGDNAAVTNSDQTAQVGEEGNAITELGIDQSESTGGDSTEGDRDITVNVEANNECSLVQEQTVELNAEVSDFSSNE